MTDETYMRAEEIQNKLKNLSNLHYIACKPYKNYFLKKNFLCISTYDKNSVCICDEGLTEVIREYCSKRMQELRKELESL
jgi:hypothetical protein